MELKIARQPVYVCRTLLDERIEQPVECDALLPDHCPDIARILRCGVRPVVASSRAAAGRLELDGMALITVCYVSEGGELARCEYKTPFSRVLEFSGEAVSPAISVSARVDYLNCRAVNQRRLDIRGAVTLSVRATTSREEQVVCGAAGGGVELLTAPVRGARQFGLIPREQDISETLELAFGKAALKGVLRSDACVRIGETRVAGGKLSVRGELSVRVLYAAASGGCDRMEFSLPVAAVLEGERLDDGCAFEVTPEVTSLALEPASSAEDGFRALLLEATVRLSARCWAPFEAEAAVDCFSTGYRCDFTTRPLELVTLTGQLREAFTHKAVLELPENVRAVTDLWCGDAVCTVKPDSDTADCGVMVSMLAEMSDGSQLSFDKALEFQHPLPPEAAGARAEPRLSALGCGYTLASGGVEARCELLLEGPLTRAEGITAIDAIELDESEPAARPADPGLYIYVPEPGESLWETARRYGTSPGLLSAENPDAGGQKPLLVPVM